MVSVEVIEDLDAAQALGPAWDEMAIACSLPLCAPGWMLAWWRHMAPRDTELRIVVVHEDTELLAIAPWFVQTGDWGRVDLRFIGAELSDRVDILCVEGREREVAQALRGTLRTIEPHPDLVAFEAVPAGSRWTRRLASGLGGRVRLARYLNSAYPAPSVRLPSGRPEDWLAGRSSNFRSQMGRMQRRLRRRGGSVRQISDPAEVQGAVSALLTLHARRWEGRAESGLTRPGVAEMLCEAASDLGTDRLRLWAAEIDGEFISVQLFIAAGGEVKYWNGGWSEEHADLKPSMLTILAALENAISRGERRLDLGAGTHPYKLRFANSQDALAWGGVIVRGRRWPRTRLEFMPMALRYRAKRLVRALPAPVSDRFEKTARARRRKRAQREAR